MYNYHNKNKYPYYTNEFLSYPEMLLYYNIIRCDLNFVKISECTSLLGTNPYSIHLLNTKHSLDFNSLIPYIDFYGRYTQLDNSLQYKQYQEIIGSTTVPLRRVAVCLAGYPRTYKVCFENFKRHVIDCNKHCLFDFFLYIKISPDKNINVKYNIDTFDYDILDILNTYKPKSYFIDNSNIQNYELQQCQNFINSLKLKCEFELKNNLKYNYVIKYRFDIFIDKPYPLIFPKNNELISNIAIPECVDRFEYVMKFTNPSDSKKAPFTYSDYFTISQQELTKLVREQCQGVSPIGDLFWLCGSESVDKIIFFESFNKILKSLDPSIYFEYVYFIMLRLANFIEFTVCDNVFYPIHQLFCVNKHPLWGIELYNNKRDKIMLEYNEHCSCPIYTNIILN
jgi:hypothetical protein